MSGWKPPPPDPYWSLPESQGGPPASALNPPTHTKSGRPLPRLPRQAPPPSPRLARASLWVTVLGIPAAVIYSVFFQDFGEKEHIYSPARRWLLAQRAQFFTLTPEERRLAGVGVVGHREAAAVEGVADGVGVGVVPVDMEPVEALEEGPAAEEEVEKKRGGWRSLWRRSPASSAAVSEPTTGVSAAPAVPVDTTAPPPAPDAPQGVDIDKLRQRAQSRWWGFK